MEMALPRYMALKNKYNGKYLRYVHEDGEVHGFNQFSEEEVVSPYSKYEVEESKNHKGLVNIRCCYNNKYWRRWSVNHWWIVAGADEPNEDKSSWSCTLFEPESVYVDGIDAQTSAIRLRHVQLGHYACLWRLAPPYGNCLFAGSASPDQSLCEVCTVVDWESLLVLPKYIAFKGDNDQYLSAKTIEGHPYLQFASTDITDPTVRYEVFTTPDGSVRIKSHHFGKFWRRSPNWIWADTTDNANSHEPDTLFWPIKVDQNKNLAALRNLGNNNFCKRLTIEGKTDCLNAAVSMITREARLEMRELVSSRRIFNVNFHLMDARIYDKKVIVVATKEVSNETCKPDTQQLKFSYEESESHSWKGNASLKLDTVELILETGIPFIVEGLVEIPEKYSGKYEWGKTDTTVSMAESSCTVTAPPKTKVTVTRVATTAYCDVPFSYFQSDTLMDGSVVIHEMNDGIHTAFNYYDYKNDIKEEKLPSLPIGPLI